MSPKNEYLRWKRLPAVGCVFARYMATRPNDFQQRVEMVRGKRPLRIASRVDDLVSAFVADDDVSAATILLTDIDDPSLLLEVAIALAAKPHWRITYTNLPDTPCGPMVAVGVVRDIPGPTGTLPSEVLVLGPFEFFPNTRKAPITAVELFVGCPMALDPKTQLPATKANLAHATLVLPSEKAFQRMWDGSVSGRLKSLRQLDDPRAKAKVAFVVPNELATSLGCTP